MATSTSVVYREFPDRSLRDFPMKIPRAPLIGDTTVYVGAGARLKMTDL